MQQIDLVKALIFESVDKLYANDGFLFMIKGLESACVARIIYYMQDMLNTDPRFHMLHDYNIDYEYNKSVGGLKRGNYYKKNYMKPDLILHIRGTDSHNLMVVEFKKERMCSNNDMLKLQDLTDKYQRYQYVIGCGVSLTKKGSVYQFVYDGALGEKVVRNNIQSKPQ